MYRLMSSFLKNRSGVALIEFVFVLPLFLLLIFGGVELTRYILISQKVEKSVYALADVVAQSSPSGAGSLDESRLETTLNMYSSMMQPFDDIERQVVIITSIQRCGANNRILWQYAGGGVMSNSDTVSIVNGLRPATINTNVQNRDATFPANVSSLLSTMMDQENMIVAETFYSYEPFLADVMNGLFGFSIEPIIHVRRAWLHPRNGTLNCLAPSFPCTDCNAVPGTPSGDECGPGSCPPNSLGGTVTRPCECTANGRNAIAYDNGPNGCGVYRCNNGNWQLIAGRRCTIAPQCD